VQAAVNQAVVKIMVVPHNENLRISEPSVFDEVNNNLQVLYTWMTRKDKLQFDLLYRGSQDGFGLENFHTKLDG
jgi:hypothetical protein